MTNQIDRLYAAIVNFDSFETRFVTDGVHMTSEINNREFSSSPTRFKRLISGKYMEVPAATEVISKYPVNRNNTTNIAATWNALRRAFFCFIIRPLPQQGQIGDHVPEIVWTDIGWNERSPANYQLIICLISLYPEFRKKQLAIFLVFATCAVSRFRELV